MISRNTLGWNDKFIMRVNTILPHNDKLLLLLNTFYQLHTTSYPRPRFAVTANRDLVLVFLTVTYRAPGVHRLYLHMYVYIGLTYAHTLVGTMMVQGEEVGQGGKEKKFNKADTFKGRRRVWSTYVCTYLPTGFTVAVFPRPPSSTLPIYSHTTGYLIRIYTLSLVDADPSFESVTSRKCASLAGHRSVHLSLKLVRNAKKDQYAIKTR